MALDEELAARAVTFPALALTGSGVWFPSYPLPVFSVLLNWHKLASPPEEVVLTQGLHGVPSGGSYPSST